MFPLRHRPSRSSSQNRKRAPRRRRPLERLEDRRLLAGDPALTLTISPATFAENAGAAAAIGTISRVNTDDAAALTVNLSSSNTNQAIVPASVVIPAGQASTTFNIGAVDDHVVTGTQAVTISAAADAAVPLSVATNFGSGGVVFQNSLTQAVAVQPDDGKVVTAGLYYTGNASANFYDETVSRYNADGTPDTTFGTNGAITNDLSGQSDKPQAVLIQPDGKIVVGGIGGDGPIFYAELARYNTDGTLDGSFGSGGKMLLNQGGYNEVLDLALQSDGKILAAGANGGGLGVIRLNPDGSLDTGFGDNGIASAPSQFGNRAFGVVVQPDGQIVLAGVNQEGNYNSQVALARFTPQGALDLNFGTGGVVETDLPGWYDEGRDVVLQPDGKLVVAGATSPPNDFPPDYNFVLIRYDANGALDSNFGKGGEVITDLGASDEPLSAALQPDGTIVVSGQTFPPNSGYAGYQAVVARYAPDGTLEDKIIPSTTGLSGTDVVVAPNGEVFVAGRGLSNGRLMAFQSFTPLSATAKVSVLNTDLVTTVTVNTLLDADAADASTSAVDTNGNGQVSLRSAIEYLNANGGGSVVFDPALFASGPAKISLSLGELWITGAESIAGPGASHLTLDASGKSRVFDTIGSPQDNQIAITGLTLTGGDGIGDRAYYDGQGGAILNGANLTLSHDTITGNTAQFGGGLYNVATLTLTDNTISNNQAQVNGGGMLNEGITTSTGDTFNGNSIQAGFNNASGGAIWNGSDLVLTNDTITGNTAQGNLASGGGVENDNRLTLSNDTISGNSAIATAAGGAGGGLDNQATLYLGNSLVIGNTSTVGATTSESDYTGAAPTGDNGHNLINQSAAGILVTGAGSSPLLANNGGPTQTIAPVARGPAVGAAGPLATLGAALSSGDTIAAVGDAGFLGAGDAIKIDNEIVVITSVDDNNNTITITRGQDGTAAASHVSGATLSLALDQRGFVRTRPDVGALEGPQASFVVNTLADPHLDGFTSLRDAVTQADSEPYPGNVAITFDPALFAGGPATIDLIQGELDLNQPVSIQGPGADQLTIDAHHRSRIFNIAEIISPIALRDTISGLTMTGGQAGSSNYGQGGALYNSGNLTLSDDAITNSSSGSQGGGIFNSGRLTMLRDTVSGNTAPGGGGGIANSTNGVLNSTDDTISGNSGVFWGGGIYNTGSITSTRDAITGNAATPNANGGAQGGGIYSSGSLVTSQDTISGNQAVGLSRGGQGGGAAGGGVVIGYQGKYTSSGDTISGNLVQGGAALGPSGAFGGSARGGGVLAGYQSVVSLTNDTISGNRALGGDATYTTVGNTSPAAGNGEGGGVLDEDGSVTLVADTISGNTATGGSGSGSAADGAGSGGGAATDGGGTLTLVNTIVVGNSAASAANVDSSLSALSHANVIDAPLAQVLMTDAAGNPLLADNGGPTETIALTPGAADTPNPALGAAAALAALQSGLNATDNSDTITVDATTFLAAGDLLRIGSEIVKIQQLNATPDTLNVLRAQDGTTETTHAVGDFISLADDQRGLPRHAAPDIGAYETQTLTPTVTVADLGGVYNGSAYSVTAASVIGQNGTVLASLGDPSLSYSYYQGTLTAAQIASATPLPGAPINVGDYTVVAHFTGVAGYPNADSSPASFSITPAKVSYTIGNDKQVYGSPADLAKDLGTTIATGINGETLGITYASTGDTATANVGSYDITGTLSAGSGALSNYTVTLTNGTLTVDPYAFTYTIGNDKQVYGSPADLAKDLGTTIATGINGETLGITYASTGDTATANAGSYPITGTLSAGSGA
ncbi:MAG TPA: hypothetical protein VF306_23085, partial [Pirellulales bacterium]